MDKRVECAEGIPHFKPIMNRQEAGSVKNGWANLVAQYPYEWWLSLSFKHPVSQDIAKDRFFDWVRKICIKEHLQIACMAVFNESHRIHVHALMLGRNRKGKTLLNVCMKNWAEKWCEKNCGDWISWDNGARIRPVYSIAGVSTYFSKNIHPEHADLSNILFYNRKLLKRCRIGRERNVSEKNYHPLAKKEGTQCSKVQFDQEAVKAEILAIIEAFHGR